MVFLGIFDVSKASLPSSPPEDREHQGVSGWIVPWTIDNKYYKAQVDLWVDELPVETRKDTIDAYSKDDHAVGALIDGFIYVYSKDKASTLDGLKEWDAFLQKHDPAIRLCVAMPSTGDIQGTNDASAYCLENEFEHVDMDAEPQDEYDKVGHELIVDALHTNMWDGMERKGQANARQDAMLLKGITQETWTKGKRERDDNTLLTRLFFLDLPTSDDIQKMQSQLFGGIDEDDGLEKALLALQGMREKSKDLPDDERRQLAAQVALSFAAQLGLSPDDL
ncbi:hypothetical protein BC940DRAFT_241012 [Gongronella butleri]|nr:hypothetical protein BC940DRAFT_241012 [Gongronella butleri]